MKYVFTGDYPESFITLGRELRPGDTFDSDIVIDHPRLSIVEEKPSKKQNEKVEVSDNA